MLIYDEYSVTLDDKSELKKKKTKNNLFPVFHPDQKIRYRNKTTIYLIIVVNWLESAYIRG